MDVPERATVQDVVGPSTLVITSWTGPVPLSLMLALIAARRFVPPKLPW